MPEWNEAIRERLRGLNLEGCREAEIVEELAQHLEDRYGELIAQGVAEGEAFREVMEELESRDLLGEELRKARQPAAREPLGVGASGGLNILASAWYDLKVALRVIRLKPAFSAAVVLMLALGVAGNAAIFSIFNGLFLRPLPFPGAERLVDLDEAAPRWNLKSVGISHPDFYAWRGGNATFDGMAFFKDGGANLSDGSGAAQFVFSAEVTHDLLDVLGLKPALGRNFLPNEDRPGGAKVVLLGYNLWQSLFRGDRNVLGKVVKLDARPFTVIGVLPREAVLPPRAEAWMPLAADPNQGNSWYLSGVGRIKRGVSLDQAKADLLRVHKGMIQSAKAKVNEITFPVLMPLRDRYLGGNLKTVTHILLGAVAVVLLIACVNIAGLMMVRGEARSREIAIRTAVGASSGRIVRQLLTESLLLAGLGGVLGVLLGKVFLRGMVSLMPLDDLPRWVHFGWDTRFALFSIAVTGAAALLFGVAPALQAAAVDARGCLQEAARSSMSRSKRGVLSALVVCEIALALMLLVCSGLLVQAFRKVLRVDPGYRPENLITWSHVLPDVKYPKPEQQLSFYHRLIDRMKALPGVTSVSAASKIPLGGHDGSFFTVEGARPLGPNERNPVVLEVSALPGYFEAMGMTLMAGRWFTERDEAANAVKVVIVNESFARQFWPGTDAIGKRLRYAGGGDNRWLQVVGVARDTKHFGLDEEMRPSVFQPFPQRPYFLMTMVMRSRSDPRGLVAPAREAIRQIDADLPMFDVRTMTERLDRSLWTRRACSWMFGAFAAVAILLAVAGIYGVVSFTVSQRTREIGIRMALGARPGQVMLGVLGSGMTLVAIGVAVGLGASMAAVVMLKTMLFGVSGRDALTYGTAVALVACVGVLANWIPARRAARVDPIRTLRFE